MSFVSKWEWEVEIIELIPRDYFILEQDRVGREVRGGARNIYGIKIYETKSVRVI